MKANLLDDGVVDTLASVEPEIALQESASFGSDPGSGGRNDGHHTTGATLGVHILNRMLELASPISVLSA